TDAAILPPSRRRPGQRSTYRRTCRVPRGSAWGRVCPMRIRPMRADDVDAAERLTARAFGGHRGAPSDRTPEQRRRWTARLRHLHNLDPDGCWVADDGSVRGVAAASRRDLLWILSTYAVDPDFQGRGAGAALLTAAIGYGVGCLRGMICSTADPRAVRR